MPSSSAIALHSPPSLALLSPSSPSACHYRSPRSTISATVMPSFSSCKSSCPAGKVSRSGRRGRKIGTLYCSRGQQDLIWPVSVPLPIWLPLSPTLSWLRQIAHSMLWNLIQLIWAYFWAWQLPPFSGLGILFAKWKKISQ
jgi:hypothetical protein